MKSVYVPVRIEQEMYDAIEAVAGATDTTISAVIREAIREFLAGYGAA